jgi:hypothetical protein
MCNRARPRVKRAHRPPTQSGRATAHSMIPGSLRESFLSSIDDLLMTRDVCRLPYLQAIPFSPSRNYVYFASTSPRTITHYIVHCSIFEPCCIRFCFYGSAFSCRSAPIFFFLSSDRFTLQTCFTQQANHSLRYFNLILDPGPDAPNLHMYRHLAHNTM